MNRWNRRQLAVAASLLSLLLLAGAAGWYWWPRQVAPGLTPQMIRVIDSSQRHITLVDGGSRRDAHTLWARYHALAAYGTPPESPRLLGVSLARVETDSVPGTGTFWVVYSDRVWTRSLGPGPNQSFFTRQVMFVEPDSLRVAAILQF